MAAPDEHYITVTFEGGVRFVYRRTDLRTQTGRPLFGYDPTL